MVLITAARIQAGKRAARRSNPRWCSDRLAFACWSGKALRVVVVLKRHDCEVIGWTERIAGISGEMIRVMMIKCVERRLNYRGLPSVQWLYALADGQHRHGQFVLTLASSGRKAQTGSVEALVKIFKRDYLRVNQLRDAR
jgi:putative transposase